MANAYTGIGGGSGVLTTIKNTGKSDYDLIGDRLDTHTYSVKQVLSWIVSVVKPHAWLTLLSFLASAGAVLLQLYVPILIGQGIDLLVGKGQVQFLFLFKLLQHIALVVASAAVLQWLAGWCTNKLSYTTVQDLRTVAYAKLKALPLSFIDSHAHGDLLSRITNDVDQIGDGLLQGFTQLFSGVITIVGTLFFMFSLSIPVGLIVVVVTPLSIVVASLIARFSAKHFAQTQQLQGELGGYAEEFIGSQKLIAAFGYQKTAQTQFDAINKTLYTAGEKAQFISSLSNPSTRLVNNLIYAIVAVVGVICIITGTPSVLTAGQVQSFLAYANQYMKPFNEISGVVTQIQSAFASARRVLALLDAPEMSENLQADSLSTHDNGEIEFKNVSFSYTSDKPFLHDLSFHVLPGQTYALVGPTGCGKTTLINLLLRFYDITGGQILVNGQDISQVSRESLREAFGMVLQDTWLFKGTIRQNIAYSKSDATDDQIITAAKMAHAHKFIQQLPSGYDTVIDEEGGLLSQGQRQLLCIARVMLANPSILLLDEATSSIDTRTERQVQDAFDQMMQGCTSLVVAHRLSTIRNADCILVIDNGVIVEKGSHDTLLSQNGFYAKLYKSQFEDL
ncbi:ABC transporter ATP-binding protein [Atopobium fossor]|uniref:ABC transporter ATP-binding protein n=1 Tax=Atopobium fossor TaxID=39487 RepID=UPI0003FFFC5A|nr:ABC transporter ATP-binding protein [Atopobium fossor]